MGALTLYTLTLMHSSRVHRLIWLTFARFPNVGPIASSVGRLLHRIHGGGPIESGGCSHSAST
jgi:hypothetical protein